MEGGGKQLELLTGSCWLAATRAPRVFLSLFQNIIQSTTGIENVYTTSSTQNKTHSPSAIPLQKHFLPPRPTRQRPHEWNRSLARRPVSIRISSSHLRPKTTPTRPANRLSSHAKKSPSQSNRTRERNRPLRVSSLLGTNPHPYLSIPIHSPLLPCGLYSAPSNRISPPKSPSTPSHSKTKQKHRTFGAQNLPYYP